MPKLWSDNVESHRQDVRAAILAAAAELATEHGVAAVKMTDIASRAGIGRATLYKYFTDVQSILGAWHEDRVERHLAQLLAAADEGGEGRGPHERLAAVLETYARIAHQEHGRALVMLFQHGPHVGRSYEQLLALLRELIADGAKAGVLRKDVAPAELAQFCLGALSSAPRLPSAAAVGRLVNVTLSGLRAR